MCEDGDWVGSIVRVGPRRPILVALARAYRWQGMLDSGEAASLAELAGRAGVDRSYVGRIIRLATLAPDITEAVLRGGGPDGVSLESLRGRLPLSWPEQRRKLRPA